MRIPTPVLQIAALCRNRVAKETLTVRRALPPMTLKEIRNLCCTLEPQRMAVTTSPGEGIAVSVPTRITNAPRTDAGGPATARDPGSALPDNISWLHRGDWARRRAHQLAAPQWLGAASREAG
jgi:hypothetical protein